MISEEHCFSNCMIKNQDKTQKEEVNTANNIKTTRKNMIKEIIKTFKEYSVEKDPANDCLDVAIITDPKLRTKKTIKKLQYVAGRALSKK